MNETDTAPIPEAADAPPIRISESDRLASVVSRGHAIDADAAKLMPLQLVGAFAGRTRVTRSVDALVCSAGFNLAMIGSDRAMVHGATMALLDEILGEFEEARNRETDEGRDQVRHRYSALMSKRKDLFTERNAAEEKLRKVNAVPMTTQEAEANRTEYRTVVEKEVHKMGRLLSHHIPEQGTFQIAEEFQVSRTDSKDARSNYDLKKTYSVAPLRPHQPINLPIEY